MATRLVASDANDGPRPRDFPNLKQEPQGKVPRRSLLEIRMDILRVVRDGEGGLGPTQIMYKANLSWMALREQLPPLVKLGMVLEHGAKRRLFYSLTERGIDALGKYLMVVEQFEDLGLDVDISDRGQPSATLVGR